MRLLELNEYQLISAGNANSEDLLVAASAVIGGTAAVSFWGPMFASFFATNGVLYAMELGATEWIIPTSVLGFGGAFCCGAIGAGLLALVVFS